MILEKEKFLQQKLIQLDLVNQNKDNSIRVTQAKINSINTTIQKITAKNNSLYTEFALHEQNLQAIREDLQEVSALESRHERFFRQDTNLEQTVIQSIASIRQQIENDHLSIEIPVNRRNEKVYEFLDQSNNKIINDYE